MGYRSDVVIQIETNNKNTLEIIANEFKDLLMSNHATTNLYHSEHYNVYVFVAELDFVKWYPEYSEIDEVEKWLEKYSNLAEVGENTYGVISTQFQRIGEEDDDNEYRLHGEPYNYLSLVRKVEIEAEDKCLPLKLEK